MSSAVETSRELTISCVWGSSTRLGMTLWMTQQVSTQANVSAIHHTIMKCKFALCFLIIMAALDAKAQSKPSATLIVTNAAVYTVDKQHPKAEAVAVIGDRIVAVGSRAEIDLWRGPQTRVIDAGGKLLLPGFNDAHVHFIQGGAQLGQVQLTDAATPEEFAKRIAAQVANDAERRVDSGRPLG